MGRRVLFTLVSAALLVGLAVQPGAAVNVPQAVVVSSNPADWTPHVLDGKVAAIVQVGNRMVAGGQFTQVASAAAPATAIARSNIFAFDASTGAIDTAFAPVLDGEVESLAVAPDGLHVFAGGKFTRINGVAQKSLVKLRLTDGARITAFKGKTNARVKDMAVSGGRLYIGGTFATVNGVARSALAAVDPVTGALSNDVNLAFTGPRTGTVNVDKFDITPDGSRLIAIGNWTYVAGLQRDQIVMVDLTTSPVGVADWATTRYQQQCARVFATYMRDIDISADGSYFVVGTTGAYRAGSMCDTAGRWETGRTGSGQQPTWVNYTGGDTLYSVAITGTAVYVGGHQRWMNNSFAGDRAGPGAVAREGIAALDPVNGLPLSWDPGRDRGVGVFSLVSTPQGLWIGSDTDRIGRFEYHGRIAFMPVAGGTPVPEYRVGTLPGDLYRLPAPPQLQRDHRRRPGNGRHRGGLVDRPRGVHGQRSPVHRQRRRHPDRPRLRRHHRRVLQPDRPERPDQHPVPDQPHHRHVLLERSHLLHREWRRQPPVLPLLHPGERGGRRRHVRGQRRHRRPQLVHRQRPDHGLRSPLLRHHHRHPVRGRLHRRPPHRLHHRPQRSGRRRPDLAVPRPVRPRQLAPPTPAHTGAPRPGAGRSHPGPAGILRPVGPCSSKDRAAVS